MFQPTVLAALTLFGAAALPAQSISISLRGTGTLPTGAFAAASGAPAPGTTESSFIEGAKSGFGYGLDLGVSLGMLGVYAGFDRINFDCETTTCSAEGTYKLQGASLGVRLAPTTAQRFRPFIKGGVTFNSLEGVYGNGDSRTLTTDRAPGYEVGVGGNWSLGGVLALSPQVRYVGQNLRAKIPGVVVPEGRSDGVNYFTFDLGLGFVTPFGSRR